MRKVFRKELGKAFLRGISKAKQNADTAIAIKWLLLLTSSMMLGTFLGNILIINMNP